MGGVTGESADCRGTGQRETYTHQLQEAARALLELMRHETGLPLSAANGNEAWGVDEDVARAQAIIRKVEALLDPTMTENDARNMDLESAPRHGHLALTSPDGSQQECSMCHAIRLRNPARGIRFGRDTSTREWLGWVLDGCRQSYCISRRTRK